MQQNEAAPSVERVKELNAVRRKSVRDMAANFTGQSVADSPASLKTRENDLKKRETAVKKDLEKLLHNPKTAGSSLQDQYVMQKISFLLYSFAGMQL